MGPADPGIPTDRTTDPFPYTRFPRLLHSWFWRYYDHLGQLVLCNLAWFILSFALGWLFQRFGPLVLIQSTGFKINPLALYLFFLAESGLSIPFAYLIFRTFNFKELPLAEWGQGTLHFLPKAIGLSALSGIILGLVLFNLRYYYQSGLGHWQNMVMAGLVGWFLFFWVSSMLYQWPILFFQDPPFFKIIYRSFLLVMSNGLGSFGILAFLGAFFFFFSAAMIPWFFLGSVFFFSFQCVMLEKHLLRYKITFEDKPLETFLESLELEHQRGWRDLLKPWESR